jgi:hypothetical protein
MAESDVTHVVVGPPAMLEANLVEKVASFIHKDVYGTRLLLAGKIPRIIAQCKSTAEAEAVVQSLKELGIVAFTCLDSELRKPTAAHFKATGLKIEEEKRIFRSNVGGEKVIGTGDVFLIVHGILQMQTEKETVTKKMKFSMGRTILAGGIPVWHGVKEKTKDVTLNTESFIRLYGPTFVDPCIEISQHDFDYSFLGPRMTFSSEANLNATAAELKTLFPGAVLDNKLTKPVSSNLPFVSEQESSEINCKLIYWYYREISRPGTTT